MLSEVSLKSTYYVTINDTLGFPFWVMHTHSVLNRAGQYILILTIYIDIVNIHGIDIDIEIEIGLLKILILILSRGLISTYIDIGIDIE